MDFQYRTATPDDLPEILSLRREVIRGLEEEGLFIWDDEYPSEPLFAEDIQGGRARLLVSGERVLGFAALGVAEEEFGEGVFDVPGLMTFSRLMVRKEFRGMGGGRALVGSLLQELKEQGAPGVGILVHPVNAGALRFYGKLSFEDLGPIRNEWGEFVRFRFLFE